MSRSRGHLRLIGNYRACRHLECGTRGESAAADGRNWSQSFRPSRVLLAARVRAWKASPHGSVCECMLTCRVRHTTGNSTCSPSDTYPRHGNPLLTKEGWRDRASPIGRSLKRRRAGVVAHTETLRCERPPHLRFQRSIPSFVRRGLATTVSSRRAPDHYCNSYVKE